MNRNSNRSSPSKTAIIQSNNPGRKKAIVSEDNLNIKYFIYPHSLHTNDSYNFQRPKEVGSIISEGRKTKLKNKMDNIKGKTTEQDNAKNFGHKYLVLPSECTNVRFDLKQGYLDFMEHVPHQNGIDQLLEFILDNKGSLFMNSLNQKLEERKRLLKPNFICWRGLLTTILSVPYEKQKDLEFTIIPFKGSFYLCEVYTDYNRTQDLTRDEKSAHCSYWGHKFETYITADFPDEHPGGVLEVPTTDDSYSTVVTTFLNEHCLMYAAEIDCSLSKEHGSLSNYCEIKTSKGNSIQDLNFGGNPKFFKWWLQTYLIDTQRIVVGLRDDQGIVGQIVECNTSQMYHAVTKRSNDRLCFNFLNSLLTLISRFCDQEGCLYLAKRQLNSEFISLQRIEKESEFYEKNYFLRDWFISATN